jgi:hypothetical protein
LLGHDRFGARAVLALKHTKSDLSGASSNYLHFQVAVLLLLLLLLSLAVILAKEKVVPDVVDACSDKAAFKVRAHPTTRSVPGTGSPAAASHMNAVH